MSLAGQIAAAALGVAEVAATLACIVLASRILLDRLDGRRLLGTQPWPWLPLVAGASLEWTLLRVGGLAPALDPYGLWTAPAWAVGLDTLHAQHLSFWALAKGAGATLASLAASPPQHVIALGVLAATTAAVAVRAWRSSAAAWGSALLHLWLTAAAWALLHHAVVLLYWTLHWLNFWVFFVLLAFAQMRRKEGSGPKVSPS